MPAARPGLKDLWTFYILVGGRPLTLLLFTSYDYIIGIRRFQPKVYLSLKVFGASRYIKIRETTQILLAGFIRSFRWRQKIETGTDRT